MRLTNYQYNRFSDIFLTIGEVCFASLFIPFIFGKFDIIKAVIGIVSTLFSWIISLILIKKS